MHKLSIVAAAITAAITLAPLPVITGAAYAQAARPPSPNYPTYPQRTTYNCTNELGHLRRVFEEELDGVRRPERVWVIPICIAQDIGPIHNTGNSGALRAHIAQNKAMKKALSNANYRPVDVVGIRMIGDDAARLYVHPLNYRNGSN